MGIRKYHMRKGLVSLNPSMLSISSARQQRIVRVSSEYTRGSLGLHWCTAGGDQTRSARLHSCRLGSVLQLVSYSD